MMSNDSTVGKESLNTADTTATDVDTEEESYESVTGLQMAAGIIQIVARRLRKRYWERSDTAEDGSIAIPDPSNGNEAEGHLEGNARRLTGVTTTYFHAKRAITYPTSSGPSLYHLPEGL
jgi:hypothetical protein